MFLPSIWLSREEVLSEAPVFNSGKRKDMTE